MLDREKFGYLRFVRPSFLINRLLRRPTVDLSLYDDFALSDAEIVNIRSIASCSQIDFPERDLLFIYGVMPRSGTNFLYEVLLRHPLFARPRILFDELPILAATSEFESVRTYISRVHQPSAEAFGKLDWMTFALAGFRNRLLSLAPDRSVTLIKNPLVWNLELSNICFPKDKTIIVIRDGRYVVDSFVRTFARKPLSRTFEDVCLEWRRAMRKCLDYVDAQPASAAMLTRYEAWVDHRDQEVATLLRWIGKAADTTVDPDLFNVPILGSSTHSKGSDGSVSWVPVKADDTFHPSTRDLNWSSNQERTFERICGDLNRQVGYQT